MSAQSLRAEADKVSLCLGSGVSEPWLHVLQGFHLGDSAKHDQKKTWQSFFAEIERCKSLEVPWTLQLRDPLANSFVSSVLEDLQKDPRMQVGNLTYIATMRLEALHHAEATP
jgi:hypothetical protein